MAYPNRRGKIGFNELSPYLQKLLKTSASNGGVYTDRGYQIIEHDVDKVSINIRNFDSKLDELLVFRNGYYLTIGIDYRLDDDYIYPLVKEKWEAAYDDPSLFDFFCIGNAKQNSQSINFVKLNILMEDTDWTKEEDGYSIIVNHNLGAENLILSLINSSTKESLEQVYSIVDKNNIKIYCTNPLNITITIIDVLRSKTGLKPGEGLGSVIKVDGSTFIKYDEDLYECVIDHNLNTEYFLINGIDENNNSVYIVYDIIDSNSIKLYNDKIENLSLSILPV